jgi:HEAT repeat protein
MPIEWSPPITQEERQIGERAEQALQQIGTNAIPTLLRMLASTERPQFDLAASGFHALGRAASSAVPTLIAMLETYYVGACSALEAIGPSAVEATPALLKQASLPNGAHALFALRALGQIHGMPGLVVPFLRDQLESCSKDTIISYAASHYIRALAGYGEQAKAAIADIQPFLTAPEEDVRASATNALRQINSDNHARAR